MSDTWKVLLVATDMTGRCPTIEQSFDFPDRLLPFLFAKSLTILAQGHRVFISAPAVDFVNHVIRVEGEYCSS